MLVLAFDTAMAALSVAVVRVEAGRSEVLAEHFERRATGHAEVLVPLIGDVMARGGTGFEALDRIAVTTGPGTFTGVRIGVAAARGLALASGVPVVGITTLEAVAAGYAGQAGPDQPALATVFDARRTQVYVQCFSPRLEPLTESKVLDYDAAGEEIRPFDPLLIGTGAHLIKGGGTRLAPAGNDADLPQARFVAERAAAHEVPREPVAPLYLRPPDAKLPK